MTNKRLYSIFISKVSCNFFRFVDYKVSTVDYFNFLIIVHKCRDHVDDFKYVCEFRFLQVYCQERGLEVAA